MLSVKNMKVGVRLGAAFALIILLLIVVSATATIKIGSINQSVDSIVSDRYLKVRLAFDVRDGVNDQIKFLRGMVLDAASPEKMLNASISLRVPRRKPTWRLITLPVCKVPKSGLRKSRM